MISDFYLLNKDTLLSLPKLNELHYTGWLAGSSTFQRSMNFLRQFLDDFETLRGPDFKFTMAGMPLTRDTLNTVVDFGVQVKYSTQSICNERVYLKNCHLFDPEALEFTRSIDYNILMKNAVDEIPACFFRNISGIKRVEVNGEVENECHLLWFLKSLNSLEQLALHSPKLSQKFYDQLPASVQLPLKLEISSIERDRQLNFDFIQRLPRFSELVIQVNLSLALLTSLVSSLNRIEPGYINYQLSNSSSNERNQQLKRIM